MKKILKFVLWGLAALVGVGLLGLGYLLFFLPNVPVEDIKVEVTPQRVERGKYLATHVTVCVDCHSARDIHKFSLPKVPGTDGQGGEVFDQKMGLPGKFVAPNITPFALKDWSDGEIYRAITSGVSKDGRPLFPLMPYLSYGQLDKEDIYSIIAYIRTLPAINHPTEVSKADFPVSLILHTMPKTAQQQSIPDTSDRIAYGKYLATAANCIDCHTKVDKGQLVAGMEYAGGRDFPMPAGILQSANITPDTETGIGQWTQDAFVSRFKNAGRYDTLAVKDGDFNTIMPWNMYAGMRQQDLEAIYAYLRTLKPIKNKVARMQPPVAAR